MTKNKTLIAIILMLVCLLVGIVSGYFIGTKRAQDIIEQSKPNDYIPTNNSQNSQPQNNQGNDNITYKEFRNVSCKSNTYSYGEVVIEVKSTGEEDECVDKLYINGKDYTNKIGGYWVDSLTIFDKGAVIGTVSTSGSELYIYSNVDNDLEVIPYKQNKLFWNMNNYIVKDNKISYYGDYTDQTSEIPLDSMNCSEMKKLVIYEEYTFEYLESGKFSKPELTKQQLLIDSPNSEEYSTYKEKC